MNGPEDAKIHKEIRDGGPAFPCEQHESQAGTWNQTFQWGMSLRDWFAGMAMSGRLSHPQNCDHSDRDTAQRAYGLADAMLAEREKD